MTSLPPSPRIQAIHDVGVKIDDALERAQLDTARREGAHEAYSNIVSSFSTLLDEINVETGGIESDIAKAWLNKLLTICQSMETHSSAQVHAARGAENQTKMLVETVKRMYDLEVEKETQSEPVVSTVTKSSEISDNHQEIMRSAEMLGVKHKLPSSPHERPRSLKEQRQRVNTSIK